MNTVHNARITLLATAFNNIGVGAILAGIVAPMVRGDINAPGQSHLHLHCAQRWVVLPNQVFLAADKRR